MISISNDDARTILQLLERAPDFYRNHAVRYRDMNDARLMAKLAKKLKKILDNQLVNRAAAQPRPKNKE